MMNELAQRVYERRRALGLTIDVVSYYGGFSPRNMILLEKYGLPPKRRQTREKIAKALGMTHDELFQDGDL